MSVREHSGSELRNKHSRSGGERVEPRTRLWLGADRDHLCLWLERGEDPSRVDSRAEAGIQTITHRTVVGQRNDHRLVNDFLASHALSWSEIDAFVLLQVPHSKTTIRVNAALLATAAWYDNHSMQVVSVDSLEDIDIESLREQVINTPGFDADRVAEVN